MQMNVDNDSSRRAGNVVGCLADGWKELIAEAEEMVDRTDL